MKKGLLSSVNYFFTFEFFPLQAMISYEVLEKILWPNSTVGKCKNKKLTLFVVGFMNSMRLENGPGLKLPFFSKTIFHLTLPCQFRIAIE